MAKENNIYKCCYADTQADRIYTIKVFAVNEAPGITGGDAIFDLETGKVIGYRAIKETAGDPPIIDNEENTVWLPPETMSFKGLTILSHKGHWGLPEPIYATIDVDISSLDLEDEKHKHFIELVFLPNKCKLRPCIVINERSTNNLGSDDGADDGYDTDIFIGKIEKGIADGISVRQRKITLKAQQLTSFVLRNIPMMTGNNEQYGVGSYPTLFAYLINGPDRIPTKSSPFAFYYDQIDGINRSFIVYSPKPWNDAKVKADYRWVNETKVYQNTDLKQGKDWPSYNYHLDRTNITFIKFSDLLDKLSEYVANQMNIHCRNYKTFQSGSTGNNISLSDVLMNKYYKQKYDGSGKADDKLLIHELYIINTITLNNGVVSYDFSGTKLIKSARLNNVYDFIDLLAEGNLCKIKIRWDCLMEFQDAGLNETTIERYVTEELYVNGDLHPVNINNITMNLNQLDNLDICNLEYTNDDIRNVQNAVNGANAGDVCTTIQLSFHNQIPNNIGGGFIRFDTRKYVYSKKAKDDVTNIENLYIGYRYWGGKDIYGTKGHDSRYWHINKNGNDFVYLMWYFAGWSKREDLLTDLGVEYPFLVHFCDGFKLKNRRTDTSTQPQKIYLQDIHDPNIPDYVIGRGVVIDGKAYFINNDNTFISINGEDYVIHKPDLLPEYIEYGETTTTQTFTDHLDPVEEIAKAQDKGCLHNYIIKEIRRRFPNDTELPYCELDMEIPISQLQTLMPAIHRRDYQQCAAVILLNSYFIINTKTSWGHDLSNGQKWIPLNIYYNVDSGFIELTLANVRG